MTNEIDMDLHEEAADAATRLHNQPDALAALRLRQAELVQAAEAWVKLTEIASEEDSDRISGFKRQALALRKETKDLLDGKVEVLRKQAAAIKEEHTPVIDACQIMLDRIEPLLTAWLKAKQAKIDAAAKAARERAEAEQEAAAALLRQQEREGGANTSVALDIAFKQQAKAAEAAEKEAARLSKVRAKVGGDFTSGGIRRSDSLRAVWTYKVADVRAFVRHVVAKKIEHLDLLEAAEKIARRMHMRAGRNADAAMPEIPGIIISVDHKS